MLAGLSEAGELGKLALLLVVTVQAFGFRVLRG